MWNDSHSNELFRGHDPSHAILTVGAEFIRSVTFRYRDDNFRYWLGLNNMIWLWGKYIVFSIIVLQILLSQEINTYMWDRVLSRIFEGLVMRAKILVSTWLERISFSAYHIILIIIYKKQMNLFNFWFGGISKWISGPPCPPAWREPWCENSFAK